MNYEERQATPHGRGLVQHVHWQYGWLDGNAIGRKEFYLAVVPAE